MRNKLISILRYSCLLCVIVFGLMSIIGSNGGGGDGDDTPQNPTATITSPSDGSSYTEGETITFSGTGSDTEDGTLTGSSLVWTSSIDGQIGTGTSFTTSSLSTGTHTITLTSTDSDGATGSDSVIITINQISDTSPPSVPTGLTATAVSSSQIDLSWTASTDDVSVTGYKVYRNGSYLKSVTSTLTSDTRLSSSTQYCYTVTAYDTAGNESNQSTQACATTLFPIATTTGREIAVSAAFDGTNFLVGLEGDVTAADNVGAQLVDQTGTLVGSLISTGRTGGAPFVASSGTNYLLVWSDDATNPDNVIYGQIIGANGTAVTNPFAISTTIGPMEIDLDSVIFNDSNYGVIWYDEDTKAVYGRDISTTGTLLTAEYTIEEGTDSGNPGGPAGMACDSTNCLAVYDTGSEIRGSMANKDGTVVKNTFVIATKDQETSTDWNPVGVEFDGTNYLVVWNDHDDYVDNPSWDIIAQFIDTSGNLTGSEIIVSFAAGGQIIPSLAFDGTKYLVVWTDARNDTNKDWVCDDNEGTCYDVYGQYIATSGNLVGSEFSINSDAGNQLGAVTYGGGKYLVLVNNIDTFDGTVGDVYGMFITP